MKKAIIIAIAAVLTLSACTKKETVSFERTIVFQPAAYVTKAGIEGTVFPTSETFGVYAWTGATLGDYFMNNELCTHDPKDGLWKSATTYYWPKTQPIDFIGYYPYNMGGVTIEPAKVTYAPLDVEASQTDVMYSSKTAGFKFNPDGPGNGIDGSTIVPIVFHHALAKVVVDARTAFDSRTEEDGTKYEWEVTLNSVSLSDFFKKGDAVFTLATEPTEGIVDWVKPTDAAGNNVWKNDGSKTSIEKVPNAILNEKTPVNVIPDFFVLPQTISPEGQKVTVNVTIKTKRNGVDFMSETYNKSAFLYLDTVPAWSINYITRYLLIIYPVDLGISGEPQAVTFDPAVADWETVVVPTSITF